MKTKVTDPHFVRHLFLFFLLIPFDSISNRDIKISIVSRVWRTGKRPSDGLRCRDFQCGGSVKDCLPDAVDPRGTFYDMSEYILPMSVLRLRTSREMHLFMGASELDVEPCEKSVNIVIAMSDEPERRIESKIFLFRRQKVDMLVRGEMERRGWFRIHQTFTRHGLVTTAFISTVSTRGSRSATSLRHE